MTRSRIAAAGLVALIAFGVHVHVAPALAAASAREQSRKVRAVDDSRLIRRVIELAQSLAPEFKADVLARLAEAGALSSSGFTAASLLEDAFLAASSVDEPIRLQLATPTASAISRESRKARALDNRLDRLTLQTRVLKALATIDPASARAFEAFVRIELPPIECRDALVFDLADVYRNLTAFAGALPEVERFLFVQRHVRGVRSSLQVGPTADMLARVPLQPTERAALIAGFAFEVEHLDDGDRPFVGALVNDSISARVQRLAVGVAHDGADPELLVEGFRTFLMRHLSAPRCADDAVLPGVLAARWFDVDLRSLTASAVPPIAYDARRARWIDRPAELHDDEPGAAYRALVSEITSTLGLSARDPIVGFSSRFSKPPEAVVGDVFVWHGDGAPAAAFLYHKATLLQGLLEYLPGPQFRALHEMVEDELVTFLAATGQSADDRIAWFLHVNDLLDHARRAERSHRERILQAFEQSNNLVLKTYGILERVAPRRAIA